MRAGLRNAMGPGTTDTAARQTAAIQKRAPPLRAVKIAINGIPRDGGLPHLREIGALVQVVERHQNAKIAGM
jgi:hypothetical protein